MRRSVTGLRQTILTRAEKRLLNLLQECRLIGSLRLKAMITIVRYGRSSSIFAGTADEIEVNLGSLDAADQLMPTYESWIVRRECWLPPFPLTRRYDRDRDATSRFEE
jgi:hypothetical protein